MTPVGARCRACARLRKNPIYDVRPLHYLRAIGAGFAVALVGAYVLASIPFFQLFGLLLLGAGVGEAVTRAANRKRGTGLAVVAVATLVLGALLVRLLAIVPLPILTAMGLNAADLFRFVFAQFLSPWGLFLALAAVIAASRAR